LSRRAWRWDHRLGGRCGPIRLNHCEANDCEAEYPKTGAPASQIFYKALNINNLNQGLILFFCFCLNALSGQKPAFLAGFKAVEVLDETRNFNPDSTGNFEPRPVAIYVWYPVKKTKKDHKSLILKELIAPWSRALPEKEERENFREMVLGYLEDTTARADKIYQTALKTPTETYVNAAPSPGKFPVVIFGNGMNAGGYFYFRQCESLARAGFVAIVVPSRWFQRGVQPGFDQTGLEMQFRDLDLAFRTAGSWAFADTSKVGMVAWSVGGLAAAMLQGKTPSVRAVLSLDAATGYEYGEKMLAESPFFNPENTQVPFLHLHGSVSSRVVKSFKYFDQQHRGPRCLATLDGADHFHFTTIACLLNDLSNQDRAISERRLWLDNLIKTYFNLHLKKQEIARHKLDLMLRSGVNPVLNVSCF
jgi:pimeloyl-ACP methyl ester carboxylesterase